jgi:signal transduction histidine kinase
MGIDRGEKMVLEDSRKILCYAIIPFSEEFRPVRDSLRTASREVGVRLSSFDERPITFRQLRKSIYSEIMRCDLIVADISDSNPNIFYEIGFAHAVGKPVFLLAREKMAEIPSDLSDSQLILYSMTSRGLIRLRNMLHELLTSFIESPRRYRPFSSFPQTFEYPPYIIDIEKLNSRDFENLCFELLTQMGFRRVEWGKEFREIDAVAALPKKDPDGYEYQELWLISMGKHAPPEMMIDVATSDPEYFMHRVLRSSDVVEEIFYRLKTRFDSPITILFILRKEGPPPEYLERAIKRMENRFQKERPYPFTIRFRFWDPTYLTNLIQQYPQIAFKYFSEEARIKSRYRKTPEEMYRENVQLTENLQATLAALEEEKKKRFMAERDAAWKDVAFKAAHKLGNPIDAADTFLQSLKRKIQSNKTGDALDVANMMDASIEESKKVIEQFKSLTRSQEIKPISTDVLPLIRHACQVAEEHNVIVDIQAKGACLQAMIDPERMAECFNELVANALHWFDKQEKKIFVKITKASKKDFPKTLDRTQEYLKVSFEDNGPGVSLENKEKIFSPFFTTYVQGTGLGLSLVKLIVERHGGQISESGKPGEGSVFEMYLPLAKEGRRDKCGKRPHS